LKHQRHQNSGTPNNSNQSLAHIFPTVNFLSIYLSYRTAENKIIEDQKREIGPQEYYDSSADCPGNCDEGRMGLKEKIESMVQNKETECHSRAVCKQPTYVNPDDICGCKFECQIKIRYFALPETS